MPFALRNSVRVQLTLAFLLVALVSWVLSSAMAYLVHQSHIHTLRQQMLANPAQYPTPIPEPRFSLLEMFFGIQPARPANRPGARPPRMQPPPPGGPDEMLPPPPDGQPFGANGGPSEPIVNNGRPPRMNTGLLAIFRVGTALLLAVLAGTLVARRFTRPLTALTEGARALHRGDFAHRVPADGTDEFAEVAVAMNEMATQLALQIRRLEDDARRRRQFLADMTHELKSPVTTLRTMAGAMAEGMANDPERRDRAVQVMLRTSDRLLHLVADLLMLARVDLHELPLHPQEVDLRELAAACLQAHAGAAAAADITLRHVEGGAPVLAQADPDRLAQVLDNLVDNAISYAGAGAEVGIFLTDGDPVRVVVADTGKGVPVEHLPNLFDAFYRADTARTPSDNHSGLGLRIARGLIEAHGGRLTLVSTPGAGTRVEISLPRRAVDQRSAASR